MEKGTDRATAGAFLKRCWRWSWLLTLPVAAAFFLWAVNTASFYRDFRLRYSTTMKMRLVDIGRMQAGLLLSGVRGALFPPSGQRQALGEVHLYINEADLKKLDSDLPYSGMEYVKGRLLYPDGKLRKVKVRYRGDFSYHWSGRKKSIRIKTDKDQLYEGMRELNLVIPKTPHILGDYLSYRLAARLGLMAPEPRFVEVYINGEYSGVELMVEQPEEQFLRRHSRMPGDLYKGEIVGRDLFPGLLMEVFYNPEFWTKDAVNNHNPPEWNEAMKRLTRLVYAEDMDGLLELIDLDSWAALAAFMTISQTVHIDYSHNWRLYFDPARGRFFPVVWDPLGWHLDAYVRWLSMQSNRMDVITSVVFERLHRDQRFLRAKHEAVEAFFAGGGEEFLVKELEDTSALEASISRDRNLHFNSTYLLSPPEVLEKMERFKKGAREVLAAVRRAYTEEPPSAAYAVADGGVQINIDGFTPVKAIELELKEAAAKAGPVFVEFVQGGKTLSRAVPAALSPDGRTLTVEARLFASRTMSPKAGDDAVILRDARITPATYWIRAEGMGRGVAAVRALWAGGKADMERAQALAVHPLDGSFHAVPMDEEARGEVWAGEVNIEGVREVAGPLSIRPGTTVRLAPGASVVVRGRLAAEGEPGRPVRFIPAREGQAPWGALVLAGRKADGSVLKDCEFKGGSGLRHRLVEYSAMLSIHEVSGVEITGCSFSDNHEVDDMVHAVYSEVSITGSEFRRAKSDALDLDYVKGRVVNSRFHDSGNDALDLMSSQVAVLGSMMSRSGDKGVSVGEGAEVFVWNTVFTGNEIGLQSKDGSRAIVHNSEFSGNRKTIDAYKKNWQYGDGGHAVVSKSRIEGAPPTITADKDSSVSVYDSYFSGETGGKKKRVLLHETVDATDTKTARTKEVFFSQATLPKSMAPFVKYIDPKVRGLTGQKPRPEDEPEP